MAASRNRRLKGWRVVGVNDNQTNEYPGRMGFHKVEKERKGQMDYILIWIGMSLSFLMGFCCRAIIGDSDDSD